MIHHNYPLAIAYCTPQLLPAPHQNIIIPKTPLLEYS